MALASAQGHWRGQKSLKGKIFIVHPFNWAALWVSPPKNNFIPQHLQNGYINSYKHIPKLFSYSHTVEILGPPPPHPFQLALPSELGGGESYTHISILPPPHPQRISSSFTLDRRLDRHWQTGRGRGWTGNGRLGEDEGGQALADR
jgi:hypothetical protein